VDRYFVHIVRRWQSRLWDALDHLAADERDKLSVGVLPQLTTVVNVNELLRFSVTAIEQRHCGRDPRRGIGLA
jgi:hypothetical protein